MAKLLSLIAFLSLIDLILIINEETKPEKTALGLRVEKKTQPVVEFSSVYLD